MFIARTGKRVIPHLDVVVDGLGVIRILAATEREWATFDDRPEESYRVGGCRLAIEFDGRLAEPAPASPGALGLYLGS